ncbi:class I SAM-dependent methyltransferase [Bacillus sp. HMF5848]|nr:class I SAM-dependent methyltransferase [Bacillus sp. HMF5848]
MARSFANYYDKVMAPLEKRYITAWRKKLLKHAEGRVLEIGGGTGINFPLYRNCEKVIAIEPNPHMIEKSIVRQKQASVPIQLIESKAEKLPFTDQYFDTIVITLVLCSVDNMEQVIQECKRVLKPNGKLLVLEHVKMEQPVLAGLQHLLTPAWKTIADGCHLNRNPEELIEKYGFNIISRKKYLSSLVVSLIARK